MNIKLDIYYLVWYFRILVYIVSVNLLFQNGVLVQAYVSLHFHDGCPKNICGGRGQNNTYLRVTKFTVYVDYYYSFQNTWKILGFQSSDEFDCDLVG